MVHVRVGMEKALQVPTLYTLNHSERCDRRPRREPKVRGASALSLILPTTGSNTRKTLSSYRRGHQMADTRVIYENVLLSSSCRSRGCDRLGCLR